MTQRGDTARERRRMVFVLHDVEAQLRARPDVVRVADLGLVPASTAWAVARSLRFALEHGGTFQPPTEGETGIWWGHFDVPLGRYPE